MKIEINAGEVLKNIDRIDKDIKEQLDLALEDAVEFGFSLSQDFVPKDDSHLMRSGEWEKIGWGEYQIIYHAPYAASVEYGTQSMIEAHGEHSPNNPVTDWAAKRKRGAMDDQQMPYLRPAMEKIRLKFPEFVKKRLKKL